MDRKNYCCQPLPTDHAWCGGPIVQRKHNQQSYKLNIPCLLLLHVHAWCVEPNAQCTRSNNQNKQKYTKMQALAHWPRLMWRAYSAMHTYTIQNISCQSLLHVHAWCVEPNAQCTRSNNQNKQKIYKNVNTMPHWPRLMWRAVNKYYSSVWAAARNPTPNELEYVNWYISSQMWMNWSVPGRKEIQWGPLIVEKMTRWPESTGGTALP